MRTKLIIIPLLAIIIVACTSQKNQITNRAPSSSAPQEAKVAIPSDWKDFTSEDKTYSFKYPPYFVTKKVQAYEGNGDEIYLADSEKTITDWQQNKPRGTSTILIQTHSLGFPNAEDFAKHTSEERIEKIANSLGIPEYVDATTQVPWTQENGKTVEGKIMKYSSNFKKISIDQRPAARVETKDDIIYVILINDGYIQLAASPKDSQYLKDFDTMMSTLVFNVK